MPSTLPRDEENTRQFDGSKEPRFLRATPRLPRLATLLGSDRPRILQPGSEPLRQGLFGEGQGLGVLAHPRHPSSDHSYCFCFYRLGFWLRRFQKGLALLSGEKERRDSGGDCSAGAGRSLLCSLEKSSSGHLTMTKRRELESLK